MKNIPSSTRLQRKRSHFAENYRIKVTSKLNEMTVIIEHHKGKVPIKLELSENKNIQITKCSYSRTARLLAKGDLYIKEQVGLLLLPQPNPL